MTRTVKSKYADCISSLKHAEEEEAAFSTNKYQAYVGIINKAAGWREKVMTSLRLLKGLKAERWLGGQAATRFSCCWLKVIEFLIDFSQFYFKFIKPGRIA